MKNTADTPKDVILDQMHESRPLPMGRAEFEEWSERIISGALVPCTDIPSIKFCLANMLLHLGPTESHKPDAFFIHSLRKFAVNQVADEIRKELYEAKKKADDAAKTEEQKAAEAAGAATLHRIEDAKKA